MYSAAVLSVGLVGVVQTFYFLVDLLSSYCVHLKAEYWSLQLLLNCLFIPSFQQVCFMYFKAK